jgi:hypothetical protein
MTAPRNADNIPAILRTDPCTLADVLRQIAAVHRAWGLWHLDDDPRDIPAYVERGAGELLHIRVAQWWEIAGSPGGPPLDLHEFALDIINGPGGAL